MAFRERREKLRGILNGGACVRPGSVYDATSIRIAQDLGFELGMFGGSVASLAVLGDPDITLITLTELCEQMRRMSRAAELPVIVDADHGYGNALNVRRTVQELETAGAAGLTLPIEKALGGSTAGALASWALPALLVGLLWLPQVFAVKGQVKRNRLSVHGLWRDRMAWSVTLFTGLQSALAYCVFGWLVPILRERGLDGITAGGIVSMSVRGRAAACLVVPHIAVRGRDQRLVNVSLCAFAAVALLGLLFAPLSTVWIWAVLQGIGQGGLIAAAMTVIVLRSRDPHVAAHLSGMAPCVGYLLAATGPLIVGLIRGWTGSFAWCAVLFVALGLGAAVNGWRAGSALYVEAETREAVD